MKFNQYNADVAKVTVHYNMPTSQIKCYNTTMLQPIILAKNQKKYLNYHKLSCCALKVYCSLQ